MRENTERKSKYRLGVLKGKINKKLCRPIFLMICLTMDKERQDVSWDENMYLVINEYVAKALYYTVEWEILSFSCFFCIQFILSVICVSHAYLHLCFKHNNNKRRHRCIQNESKSHLYADDIEEHVTQSQKKTVVRTCKERTFLMYVKRDYFIFLLFSSKEKRHNKKGERYNKPYGASNRIECKNVTFFCQHSYVSSVHWFLLPNSEDCRNRDTTQKNFNRFSFFLP